MNKDNIQNNNKLVEHGYKVGDKVMLNNNAAYKYETSYNMPICDIEVFYQWHGHITVWCDKNQA